MSSSLSKVSVYLSAICAAGQLLVGVACCASESIPLKSFYVHYTYGGQPNPDFASRAPLTNNPPQINKVWKKTGFATGEFVNLNAPIDYALRADYTGGTSPPYQLGFYGSLGFPCRTDPLYVPLNVNSGDVVIDRSEWRGPGPEPCGYNYFVGPPDVRWRLDDVVTFGAPIRRVAQDGGEYDASPMAIIRNGAPWMTYHWGYRLGLVASESNWNPSLLPTLPVLADWPSFPSMADNFELVALPPPWIEEGVVEYVNSLDFPRQPQGQYFYTARSEDKAMLDALPHWSRTGKSFKSGGYVSACRFYGGKNGGPNTHFYSADDKECAALKAIPQLSYEGQTFAVNMPMPAKNAAQAVPGALRDCPIESKPLYRIYNNASASSGRFVSNHRYLTERTDVSAAVAQGWVDEGHVMCVPN